MWKFTMAIILIIFFGGFGYALKVMFAKEDRKRG